MRRSLQALGRLKPGQMNKTEKRYDEHLDALLHHGVIAWYKFEGITLKLAPDCRLTVDFAVMTADGLIEMHDVKGSPHVFTDDAKVKMKVAASAFPFVFKVAFPLPAKDGGGWRVETI